MTRKELSQLYYLNRENGLSWGQVAFSISPYASGESVRKAHDRFLKKN